MAPISPAPPEAQLPPRICILGAGPSGLAMARALLAAGLTNFVLYDRQQQVGGNWSLNDPSGHSSVYESVRSISSKRCIAFPGFPFPPETPDYPTRFDLLAYLKAFTRQFKLEPFLRLSTQVTRVEKVQSGSTSQWRVTLDSGDSSLFDAVCICNGHHSVPLLPHLPGEFTGTLLHSHDFQNSLPFAHLRGLVLGGGNSAADIAVDLARRSGSTTLSLRRGYHVIPRHIFGIPSDLLHTRLHILPKSIIARLAPLLFRVAQGAAVDAWPRPDHPLFSSHPLIHTELPKLVASGKIRVKGPITRVEAEHVTFADGTTERFDFIVACTGYRLAFPFLYLPPDQVPPAVPLTLGLAHPNQPGLFFLGLIQPSASIWPLAALQAEIIALHLAGRLPLPTATEPVFKPAAYVQSPRHQIEVDFFDYRRLLLRTLKGRVQRQER